jgi:TetR/AcrR family transcriptional regulator, cholesterol catabolism regulator
MSTPPDTPHPRTAILEAAMRLFSKHGFPGTTMRDIANAVEMLPGSLYAHIDGKETLLVELVESGIEKFLSIEQLLPPPTTSAEGRLRVAIKAHVALAAENPERALVVFHQWRFLSEQNLPRAKDKRRRYQKIFEKIMEDGIKSGDFDPGIDARIAVFTILGALNWTPEWYSPHGPAGADEIGEKLADYLLRGLCSGGRNTSPSRRASPAPKSQKRPGAR